jgi:hypothetical protein
VVLAEDFQEEVAQAADGKMEKMKNILGKNLISILKYKTGDIENFLFVLKELNIDDLDLIKENFKENWVFLTEDTIKNGTDVFPLEFYNIKTCYELVYGKDIFKDISFKKEDIRRQLEFEFRSKLIHLRQEYISLKEKDIEKVLFSAIPALTPVLKGMAFLKGIKFDENNVVEKAGEAFGVDLFVLKELENLRKRKEKIKNDRECVMKLMKILKNLGEKVDKL